MSNTHAHALATGILLVGLAAAPVLAADAPAPHHAYPPSCLADPLPTAPSGETWSAEFMVRGWDDDHPQDDAAYPARLDIWRVACDATHAATLMRVTLLPADDEPDIIESLPPRIIQDHVDPHHSPEEKASQFRLSTESGSATSNRLWYFPEFESGSFTAVLDNYVHAGDFAGHHGSEEHLPRFDFNQAFRVELPSFDPGSTDAGDIWSEIIIDVPAYAPDPASYPDAYAPLRLSGHINGIYYDPAFDGSGVNIQVHHDTGRDRPGVNIALFTTDADGNPFWLGGDELFDAGERSVRIPLRFHDASGPHDWGHVDVRALDCSTLQLDFSDTGLPAYVPAAADLDGRTWKRLIVVDALTCN